MTPKEKAGELYNKFFYAIPVCDDEGTQEHLSSKKCALIAVDEILKVVSTVKAEIYWEQVKQEIEKL